MKCSLSILNTEYKPHLSVDNRNIFTDLIGDDELNKNHCKTNMSTYKYNVPHSTYIKSKASMTKPMA